MVPIDADRGPGAGSSDESPSTWLDLAPKGTVYRLETRNADGSATLLDSVLSFKGAERHSGLVKSRAILAGYFAEHGLSAELARVEASLSEVPPAVLEAARDGILTTLDPVFWEINHRGTNFDYVEAGRRGQVASVFDRLLTAS